jgi:hypothetical protein
MPATSKCGSSDQLPAAVPDTGCAAWWPWSVRIAGAMSHCPAVELYEGGSLLDVVTSTRLAAQLLRGGTAVRSPAGGRVLAWGRLPLSGGLPVVEFSRGTLRGSRLVVPAVTVTSWCWLAIGDALYDRVTVQHDAMSAQRRLRVSRASW